MSACATAGVLIESHAPIKKTTHTHHPRTRLCTPTHNHTHLPTLTPPSEPTFTHMHLPTHAIYPSAIRGSKQGNIARGLQRTSASAIVESLCAIVIVVIPVLAMSRSDCCTSASVSESMLAVASSHTRILTSTRSSARAMPGIGCV